MRLPIHTQVSKHVMLIYRAAIAHQCGQATLIQYSRGEMIASTLAKTGQKGLEYYTCKAI